MLLTFSACKDETPEPEIQPYDFVGEWVAEGDDVALLFRQYPLNVRKVFIRFRVSIAEQGNIEVPLRPFIYIEKFQQHSENKAIISSENSDLGAPFFHAFSGLSFDRPSYNARNIFPLTVSAHRKRPLTDQWDPVEIYGIFSVNNDTDPPEMLLEFVYKHWNIIRPTPEAGFGSTANGAYGLNNVHRLTKVIQEEDEI